MIDIRDLSTAVSALEPTAGPAIALAAVDVACTATGLLLGQSHDVSLLGCSAAVVSLDAAYAELRLLDGTDGERPPLVREVPDDAVAVITAVLGLISATADAVRWVIGDAQDGETALGCARAVVQLEMAARFLRDDLP